MNAKQFITAGTFVSAEDGLGSVVRQPIKSDNLVAVTVTVDADRGVANQIAPGDHVNIAAKARRRQRRHGRRLHLHPQTT